MTTRKRLKRLVRARAAKTGESYTAALRHFRQGNAEEPPMDMSCSFCGKRKSQVDKIVAGPGVFICSECIRLAYDIISPDSPYAGGDDTNAGLDRSIRQYLEAKLGHLGAPIEQVDIQFADDTVRVDLFTSRIGLVVGPRGRTADEIRAVLSEITGRDVRLNIREP